MWCLLIWVWIGLKKIIFFSDSMAEWVSSGPLWSPACQSLVVNYKKPWWIIVHHGVKCRTKKKNSLKNPHRIVCAPSAATVLLTLPFPVCSCRCHVCLWVRNASEAAATWWSSTRVANWRACCSPSEPCSETAQDPQGTGHSGRKENKEGLPLERKCDRR